MVLNIYNTVDTCNTKKSGTITGKSAILEPQFQTNIWVASVDATQKLLQIQIHMTDVNTHVASNGLPFMLTWTDALASDANVSNNAITKTVHRYSEIGSQSLVLKK